MSHVIIPPPLPLLVDCDWAASCEVFLSAPWPGPFRQHTSEPRVQDTYNNNRATKQCITYISQNNKKPTASRTSHQNTKQEVTGQKTDTNMSLLRATRAAEIS